MKIKQKDINFYDGFVRTAPVRKKQNEFFRLLSIFAISLVIISVVVICFRVRTLNLERNITTVNNQIDNIFADERLQQSRELNTKADNLVSCKENIDALSEYLKSVPQVSENLISAVADFKSVNVKSVSFNREKNLLSIEAYTDSAEDISLFVKNLRDSGGCFDVKYSGYTAEDDIFSFSVVCILNDDEAVTDIEY